MILCKICGNEPYHPLHVPGQGKRHDFEPDMGSELKVSDTGSFKVDDRNPWIQTYTGRQFFPLSPRPADIEIEDIAHALAMKCRFTGHPKFFYSVGQHSISVANAAFGERPRHNIGPEEYRNITLWALLHDAAEAYLPDVASPLKPFIPGFIDIEQRIMEAIAERFGLTFPCPLEVHAADLRMLATEYRDLMHQPPPAEWEHIRGVEPYAFTIKRREIACVKEEFLRRFFELTGKG